MHPDDAAPAIFLSYASSDRDQALLVRAAFEQRGLRVLMDVDFIPGQLAPITIAAAAQLEALLISGFLDGHGDWYGELRRQHAVMLLLDDLYAGAKQLTCPSPM